MIDYEPFWNTLKDKNISTYALIKVHSISSSTVNKLRKGEAVTTITLDRLCTALECGVGDIVSHSVGVRLE